MNKTFSAKEFRWRGLLLEVSQFHNTTNFRGSKFLGSNVWLGKLRLYIRVDWFRWPDFRDRERLVEVQYMFPILGRHRAFTVKLSWKADW